MRVLISAYSLLIKQYVISDKIITELQTVMDAVLSIARFHFRSAEGKPKEVLVMDFCRRSILRQTFPH